MPRIPVEAYAPTSEALVYDETTPSCLRWKVSGKPAGSQDQDGYFLVRVGARPGKLFKAHRVIWYLHHGTLPDLVDHKDGNPANNRLSNLRIATESQNRHNASKHSDNTSGAKGVYWDKRTKKWMVKVSLASKSIWGGRFTNFNEAVLVAKQLREDLHKEFSRHD